MKKLILAFIVVLLSSCGGTLEYNEELIVTKIRLCTLNKTMCIYTLRDYDKITHTWDSEFEIERKIGEFEIGDTLIIIKK